MPRTIFKNRFYNLLRYTTNLIFPDNYSDYLPICQDSIIVNKKPIKAFLKYLKLKHKADKKYNMPGLEATYNFLSDEYSKEIFTRLTVSKLCGNIPHLFPRYYSDYLNKIEHLKKTITEENSFTIYSNGHPVQYNKYDLSHIGYPIKMYYSFEDVIVDFVLEQYRYKDLIQVEEGDHVINGGACYGNTALYFAHKVGASGKVYSFEFIDENLEIYDKNMEMNPELKNRIELIKHPIDKISDRDLYMESKGPASLLLDKSGDNTNLAKYKTLSIDDFVKNNNITKVDFIKLDIEGSELSALQGAKNTIKTFKPKLAICVYHKTEDLWEIPAQIKEILPEYNIYLEHFTLKNDETVLFAKYNRG